MNPTETVLLFNLSESDRTLVRQLIAPFALTPVDLTMQTVRNYIRTHQQTKICLAILRLAPKSKQHRSIQLVRDFIGPLAPILILVPRDNTKEIKKYLAAGADDFIDLPLNRNRFSISFLILLELGQVMARRRQNESPPYKRGLSWHGLYNYFQAGLDYFSPKSLIPRPRRGDYIFDRWEIIKRLGIGGFGVVWLVRERASGRLAVAKSPHSSMMNIRVLRSAAILKRLVHHPNVVQLIEIVKDSGKFILIQEYVDGPSLQELLRGPISPLERESYFLQLVSAVAYAHKHNILHRDIKPENILINGRGQVKLLDFGIARDLNWQSGQASSEGTVNFMPPEQFAGRACLASDVWALGVILYIFATNQIPYLQQNDTYPADLDPAMTSRPPNVAVAGLNPELERIIMTCLQGDLAKRYQNSDDLLTDIRTSLPGFGRGTVLPVFP
ncbi:serine/threonine protein kinase [Desulforhopalus singaporensis]|uniref:Serine/threonine protein kinase n=1 Tax=Desulforhopalus singaporensis TaxID=91360 RepID=A0A1H0RLD1_9BACT|nr:serine/threonine-protein kinase [Desulforhopalus singaporensis]SDP29758.1 Serine/threonine protein kinase [Desulforhopalus singaporensis]